MDNFKEDVAKALKSMGKTVVKVITTSLKPFIIAAVAIVLIIIALVGCWDAVLDLFSKNTGEHMSNSPVEYNAKTGEIVIEQEQIQEMKDLLSMMGTSAAKLHLTDTHLEKMYAAEVVTKEINRGVPEDPDKYYGRVYIKKANDSTAKDELIQLQYVDYQTFYTLDENEILKYFSINDDEDLLCVASTSITYDEAGNEIASEIRIDELEYKSKLLPYMMPVEYLLDLAIVTESPDFVLELAKKVLKETEIYITLMYEEQDTRTETTSKYKIETEVDGYTITYDKDGNQTGNTHNGPNVTVGAEKSESYVETVVTKVPTINITYVDTWILHQENIYVKTQTDEEIIIDENDPSNIIDPKDDPKGQHNYVLVDSGGDENGGYATYSSTITRKVDKKQSVKINITTYPYVPNVIMAPEIKAEEYIELLTKPYEVPESGMELPPMSNILSGSGVFLGMLADNERTEALEIITRYVLYVYTGDNFGITQIDPNIFDDIGGKFEDVGGFGSGNSGGGSTNPGGGGSNSGDGSNPGGGGTNPGGGSGLDEDIDIDTYISSSGMEYLEYKQFEGPWATMPYAGGTIGDYGCSITCLAIIASAYGYDDWTPAHWSTSNGSTYPIGNEANKICSGSKREYIMGRENQGKTRTESEAKKEIKEHLQQGKAVLVHVIGSNYGGHNASTTTEHWLALLDIKGNRVYVSNPGSNYKTGEMDLDVVLESLCCYIKIDYHQ